MEGDTANGLAGPSLISNNRQKMKQQFLRAPLSVRIAAIAMAAYPVAISIYSFRLYAHPKNPDAWFVIGVLEAAYLLPAFGVVFGSRLARWFCLGWIAVSITRGAVSLSALSSQPPLQLFVITCWVIQAAVVSLLFTPSSSQFFRKKQPIQRATDNDEAAPRRV